MTTTTQAINEITDFHIVEAMREYGGGFVRNLAVCYLHADKENQAIIKAGWPVYWQTYRDLAATMKETTGI
ncbi:hypothetical protein [Propionivibrio sp.]|uniref:hypothetical protein n=1 Tax=Propionivibrio sp. TaxID=2212460 RepID=UPI003BF1FF39